MSSLPTTTGKRKRFSGQEEEVHNVVKKAKKAPNLVGSQTIVTVNVRRHPRAKAQPFRVHKNYICHYSPYFEAAFNGSFVEGQTQVLELGDTQPKIFGIFVNWLYTQTIINEEGDSPSSSDCINLWILADKILAPKLQNQALTHLEAARLSDEKGKRLGSGNFQYVWDNTTEDSPLRAYLVEVMIKKTKRGNITFPEHYPHEMLVAIINGMRNREMDRNPPQGPWQLAWKLSDNELDGFKVSEEVWIPELVQVFPELRRRNSQ